MFERKMMFIFLPLNKSKRQAWIQQYRAKIAFSKRKRNRSMFGQKLREREREKCTYLNMSLIFNIDRQRSDASIYIYIYKLSLVFTVFSLSLLFFDNDEKQERIHTKQCIQGQSSGQLVRLFICIALFSTFIVVYYRQKNVVLCHLIISRRKNQQDNKSSQIY